MNRKLTSSERKAIEQLLATIPKVSTCVDAIAQAGGQAFLVGGAVRDFLLKLPLKDLDFEVHGLSLEQLKKILAKFGMVNEVGKSFGVLKFRVDNQHPDVDWSLPRFDSAGRKPKVEVDPDMTIDQALRRRDLTMNAMAINLQTFELHDPFGGEEDLTNKLLRCPDAKLFVEDPLRFYRVMQFVGRFAMLPDAELDALCADMDLKEVSRERVEEEMKKLMLKSKEPSRAFWWLHNMGRLQALFPEIAALAKTEQSAKHHPEGNVFKHTMQVIDAAALVRERLVDEHEKLALMYAALCHDLGKATTTILYPDGKVTSHGHEVEGVGIAKKLLKRFCGNKDLITTVTKLVRHHMDPGNFVVSGARLPAYKRLALKLAPETNCAMLALVMEADQRGRNPDGTTPLPMPTENVEQFLEQVKQAEVLQQPEAPVLLGRDLLDIMQPGPKLGEILKKAYEIQLNEGIKDKAELRKRVLG